MIETIMQVVTILASLTALYFSVKKQGHETALIDETTVKTASEGDKIDADTIKTLYGLVNEQETRYKNYKMEQEACYAQLKQEFELYKNETSAQIADVVHENKKLRTWARRLCKQLEAAGIVPEQYEV